MKEKFDQPYFLYCHIIGTVFFKTLLERDAYVTALKEQYQNKLLLGDVLLGTVSHYAVQNLGEGSWDFQCLR